MILVDAIKIKYIQAGYLPDWPYHLISDAEMIDAFIFNEYNFFDDNYKIDSTDEDIMLLFSKLKAEIVYFADKCKTNNSIADMPHWVISYMLGAVTCPTSPLKDIDELISLSNLKDLVPSGEMNTLLYRSNAKVSREWIAKLPSSKKEHRPVTIFGEPHVLKSLRLAQVDVLN